MTIEDIIATICVDRRGVIERANALACELFGYDDLRGHPLSHLLPARSRDIHEHHRETYDRKVRRMGADREVFGLRSDGREIPLWVGLSPRSRGRTIAGMVEVPGARPGPLNPA